MAVESGAMGTRPVVVNVRDLDFELGDGDVYIGRENLHHALQASRWANPFKIGPDGTRGEVLEKYGRYLRDTPRLVAALPSLLGKRLVCWCSPRGCHGDVIVEVMEEMGLVGGESGSGGDRR